MIKISRRKFIGIATTVSIALAGNLLSIPDTSLFLHRKSAYLPFRPQGFSLHPKTSEAAIEGKTNSIESYKPMMEKFPDSEIKKILYFYPWYIIEQNVFHHWRDGYELVPLIGIYDSRDPYVIEWQMKNMYAVGGIPAISYFRKGKPEEKALRKIVESDAIKKYNVKFCLHIETDDLFDIDKTKLNIAENTLGLQLTSKREAIIKNEFDYISGENGYFDNPNYYTIDKRCVVFIYNADGIFDPLQTKVKKLFKDIRKVVEENGKEMLIIGESDFWKDDEGQQKYLTQQFDGITTYCGYEENGLKKFGKHFDREFYKRCKLYKEAEKELLFIPNVTSGFKVKGKPEWLRDITSFRERVEYAMKLIDDDNPMITITSYNEYNENTSTEPNMQEGYKFWDEIGKIGTRLWYE
jgi:hypothetical protein